MRKTTKKEAATLDEALPGLLRARDLEARGITRGRLTKMMRCGEVQRVAHGLYRLHDAPLTELETVASVSRRIPGAIICLLTALHIHGIRTQAPRDVWIALDRKARKPQPSELPVTVVRFSGPLLRYAIEATDLVAVRPLTRPA